MKSIPTSELLKQLNNANNLNEYFKQNQEYFLDNTISEYLYNVFAEKCLVKSRVFRKAEIDEILEEHKGSIDMQCECCGTHYFFNKEAIDKLKQAQ